MGTNISRRVLSGLQLYLPKYKDINYQIIFGHPRSFKKYIPNDKYDLIIGLGDYYGESQKSGLKRWRKCLWKEALIPCFD